MTVPLVVKRENTTKCCQIVKCLLFCQHLQKDKAVNDKKEDKKTKAKAKESTEPEANEENHAENNGEAKTNEVCVCVCG